MPEYKKIYTERYYSGQNSFFYKFVGGYWDFPPFFDRLARWFGPYVPKGNLLDIGCAYGYVLSRFSERCTLYGVDVSEHAISVARKSLSQGTFSVAALGVDELPFDPGTFHAVLTTDVIEHLTYEDQRRAVRDIVRVLKPGGFWSITTPNLNAMRKMFYRIPDRMEHHFGMRNYQDWITLFRAEGLILVDHWTFVHGLLPFRSTWRGLPELAFVLQKPADSIEDN